VINSTSFENEHLCSPQFRLKFNPKIFRTFSIAIEPRKDLKMQAEVTNSIGLKLIRISSGTFMMGSPESEDGRSSDEHQHQITLTTDFYMGVTQVTQSQFERLMGNVSGVWHIAVNNEVSPPLKWEQIQQYIQSGQLTAQTMVTRSGLGQWVPAGQIPELSGCLDLPSQNGGSDRPAAVSWYEAVEFCGRLSELPEEKKASRVYRLPTEAEWEYACRAGSKTAFNFGRNSKSLDKFAWFDLSLEEPNPVGQLLPNAWGLHDMHGNVWEWCSDWYGPYPNNAEVDPIGPENGSERVIRGGSFQSIAKACRSACRAKDVPSMRDYSDYGFRVALCSSEIPK
jgi:formylglycine-generating enzyme required for sulfatase activity